ncbi:MAG: hypothetical protein LBJ71_03090 [Holosporaceae bacterium]|jgi:opacity protein-like surface antigen|nr:hypothetical protein [Holosporaceae bacterium]
MKKILILTMVSCFSVAVHADEEEQIVNTEENYADPLTGCYFALGIGGNFIQNKGSADLGNIEKKDVNTAVATTVLGAGKVFANSIYLGGEALADFCKSHKNDLVINSAKRGTVKNSGIVPALALRTGWVKNDCLFYAKLGAALPRTTYSNSAGNESLKISKPSWTIGLGVEKVLCRKFSGRLEGEYLLGHKKNVTMPAPVGTVKPKARTGFNIRALVAYNVKF